MATEIELVSIEQDPDFFNKWNVTLREVDKEFDIWGYLIVPLREVRFRIPPDANYNLPSDRTLKEIEGVILQKSSLSLVPVVLALIDVFSNNFESTIAAWNEIPWIRGVGLVVETAKGDKTRFLILVKASSIKGVHEIKDRILDIPGIISPHISWINRISEPGGFK